jgi:prepilin-type N-terminal cleavage/methylation domain-containing protein
MKKTKKAFSLIEVITATVILSIAVFWVFKLIWENQKILNNTNNYNTTSSLFLDFQECIKNNSWSISDNEKFYMNINDCKTWSTNTWITLNNIEYTLYWSGIWNNSLDLYIKIENWLKLKQKYVLK